MVCLCWYRCFPEHLEAEKIEVFRTAIYERQQVVSQVNSTLTMLFWHIGKRINENILQNRRAEYGKQIVSTVSTQLEIKHGRNFTEKNVRRMMQFAEQFDELEIVVPLARQLSWSHFLILIPLERERIERKKLME